MLSSVVFMIVFGFAAHYFLFYRDWFHWNQDLVLKVRPGPCQIVKEEGGSEDIVHIGDGIFLISTHWCRSVNILAHEKAKTIMEGFQFIGLTGDVIGLDVNGDPKILQVNKSNIPDLDEPVLASPHGMALWTDPSTGQQYLFVLTHPPSKDKIQLFEVLKSPLELRHIKTITDPCFTYMNDIVAVDKDRFYITKYTMYRDIRSIQLEHLSHLKMGKILYYDGLKAREVSSGYFLPNGINISPDKKIDESDIMSGRHSGFL